MNLMKAIKGFAKATKLKTIKHAPELLIGVGTGALVGAVVTTAIKSEKTSSALADMRDELEDANPDISEEEARKVRRGIKVKYIKKIACNYIIPGALTVSGVACIGLGTKKFKTRQAKLIGENAVLGAALTSAVRATKEYQNRVADAIGEDAEKDIRYGVKRETVEREEVGKNGKVKKVKDTVTTVAGPVEMSVFTRVFDASSSCWEKSATINLDTLIRIQNEMNHVLKQDGIVFWNTVLERLDIPKCPLGQIAGWTTKDLDPDADGVIDFGLKDIHDESKRRFVNGLENVVWLDFNCQGNILQYIDKADPRLNICLS